MRTEYLLHVDNYFFRGLKSFQEEFFDETNNNIISMFDLLLNVDSTSISENIELWNQSSRATNVRRINSANHHRGLSLLLNISSEDYFITTDDFIGLKVSCFQCCQLFYQILIKKYIFSKMIKVDNTAIFTISS